jgi:Uncharacterised protein family (UPF0236)
MHGLPPLVLWSLEKTMHTVHPTIDGFHIKATDQGFTVEATVRMTVTRPESPPQGPAVIDQLDREIDAAGQQVKRAFFAQALQVLDRDNILAFRRGCPVFAQRGKRAYTFKTLFGTVRCPLVRVAAPDHELRRPSVDAWGLPAGTYITAGLRRLLCDLLLDLSVRKAVTHLEAQTGEQELLSRTQLWEIVCAAGQKRSDALAEQAEATLTANPAAACLLPSASSAEEEAAREEIEQEAEEQEAFAVAADAEPPAQESPSLIGFGGVAPLTPWDQANASGPRRVDAGTVVVEADEVVTHAQKSTGQKRMIEHTAVILTTLVSIHLCAASSEQLQRLVAAALLDVGLSAGRHRLLFVCDGARWIRAWFRGLGFADKTMLLCWYHLRKRCQQCLSMACRGRAHREEIERGILEHLWHGRLDEAIAFLQKHREEMKNTKALDDLTGYLQDRTEHIPDYAERREQGLINASTCVEKMNDWTVSHRCKGQGMSWHHGVHALATLNTDRLNAHWHHIQETVQAMAA